MNSAVKILMFLSFLMPVILVAQQIKNSNVIDRADSVKLQQSVFKDQVKPLLSENPDWKEIETIIKQHKETNGELILGLSVVHYLNAARSNQRNATRNLIAAATRYDNRFDDGAYNNWAWMLFKKSNNRKELKKGLEWAKKAVTRNVHTIRYAGTVDTYANLLYKLGRRKDALLWQSKAVEAAPMDKEIKNVYEKMLKSEPTWDNSDM